MKKDPVVVYLHGFASAPSSTKAQFFKRKLSGIGIEAHIPDLNYPSFESLTLSSQLAVIKQTVESASVKSERPILLFGSSMGGLLATMTSQNLKGRTEVLALVLLAPGFGLPRRWTEMMGADGLEEWKRKGTRAVFHHGESKELELQYGFITDAMKYQTDEFIVSTPTLVFHGTRDDIVPASESERFAQINPDTVTLHLLDDGHELIEPLEHMWSIVDPFLKKQLN